MEIGFLEKFLGHSCVIGSTRKIGGDLSKPENVFLTKILWALNRDR